MTKGAIIDLSAEFCPMQTDGASTLKTYNLFLVAHIFSFFVFLKKKSQFLPSCLLAKPLCSVSSRLQEQLAAALLNWLS